MRGLASSLFAWLLVGAFLLAIFKIAAVLAAIAGVAAIVTGCLWIIYRGTAAGACRVRARDARRGDPAADAEHARRAHETALAARCDAENQAYLAGNPQGIYGLPDDTPCGTIHPRLGWICTRPLGHYPTNEHGNQTASWT